MIKDNELRRGNLIKAKGAGLATQVLIVNELRKREVITIDKNGLPFGLFYEEAEGIPLSEEVLKAAGFKKKYAFDDYTRYLHYGRLQSDKNNIEVLFYAGSEESFSPDVHKADIKFLHQIQNFVFALDGEEIDIKL